MTTVIEHAPTLPAYPQAVAQAQTSLTGQTRSLQRNFLWAFAGNVAQAAAQWGMLVALTKWVAPEGVGNFALGLAIAAPVILFTNLELRSIQATDARKEFALPTYLGLRLAATCVALLVIGALLLIGGFSQAATLVILATAIRKVFESGSDILYGLFQQHERMDIIAKSMLLNSAMALVAFVTAIYLSGSVFWGMVAWAVTCALTLIVFDVRNAWTMLQPPGIGASTIGSAVAGLRQLVMVGWNAGALLKLVWVALPMGFVMMVFSLNMNIPRYFIGGQLGERELGIFAAMAYPFVAGAYMVNALGHSANPRLARHFAAGDTASFFGVLVKLLAVTAVAGVAVIGGAVLLGRPVLRLLYTNEYAQYDATFVWLAVAAVIGFMSAILSQAMTAARCLREQAVLSAGVVLITLVACALLVERRGLNGAAFALVIAESVRWVAGVLVFMRAIRRQQTQCGSCDAVNAPGFASAVDAIESLPHRYLSGGPATPLPPREEVVPPSDDRSSGRPKRSASMSNPLVSVMMPSHNAKETLPLALSSLVGQTYAEWECILVDDGSTDGSHEIIERVNDKRVNYIRLERNVGRGAARQIALDHARGDLLCFLDADDWLFPTKLARQVEFMSQEPTVSLVSAGVAVVDGADNIVGVRRRGASGSQTPVICGPFNRLQRPPFVLVPSMMRMGPAKRTRYDPRLYLAQDFAFLLEVLRGNRYAVLPDILYTYRESAPQTMKRMIETRRYDRMIYWSYRRRYPVQAGTMIMMTSAKGLVYRVASGSGLGSRCVTRRSEPPSRADRVAFEQARENVELIADRIFASPSQAAAVSFGGRFAPQPVQ